LIISFIDCDFRGLLFFLIGLIVFDLVRIDVQGEAANQLSSLYMLTIDDHGAILCDLALFGVRLLAFATFLQLNLLHLAIDDLFYKLMSLVVSHLVIVCLSLIGKNNVALLWASGILDSVATGYTFSVLDYMMLSCSILHVNETPSR
jgi:hypothetical protein